MIRHIVTWKLTATDDAEKAAAIAAIAVALEPLGEVIPGIQALRVHANMAYFDRNWDVVLIGDYDSVDALDAYQVHPQHVEAAAVVRQYAADRVAVDIEL